MNQFTFDEIHENDSAEFSVEITQEKMDLFLALTGDNNPMHVDSEFAKNSGQKDVLVYGMLVSSFYSTLAGVYLPGKNCLLQEVNSQFCLPVFVGDVLKVSGKVVEKDETFRRITIKAEVRNQDGKKVNRAKIIAGVLK